MTALLLSVNVGLPRGITWCRVGRLNLEGDGQGDSAGHGREQRAVMVCQIESYRYLSGSVVYGPEPLDQPAEENLLVCCSQPLRDVVIDL
jgi:MOSC domain-containing protein YiiM